MTKVALISILLTLLSTSTAAQNSINGIVSDSVSGEPIDNVLCQLVSEKGRTQHFSFSDTNGNFSLRYITPDDSVEFSLLGYASRRLSIHEIKIRKQVTMSPAETMLQEIIVAAPPIREKGDTLVYNVGSFATQSDNYIADILRKLPGVTVNDNGSINYQGEAINKFYIEGRDLLGGNYSLASNNLDVNAVNSVEIIEHNQHIKSLNGIENSNRAAINLRLKNNFMVKPFGECNIGIGSDRIYDCNLTATLLGQTNQALLSAKTNNSGNDILAELDEKFDVGSLQAYISPYSPIISGYSFQTPPIDISRYRFNQAVTGSANVLIPVTKDSELKFNVAYETDKINQNYYQCQFVAMGGNQRLNLLENASGRKSVDNLKAAVSYELNASHTYLLNEFQFQTQDNKSVAALLTHNDSIDISAQNKPLFFKNKLNLLYRTQSNHIINFISNIQIGNSAENLTNKAIDGEHRLQTHFSERFITTKNLLRTSFRVFRQQIGIDAAANYQRDSYDISNPIISTTNENISFVQQSVDKFSIYEYGLTPKIDLKFHNNNLNIVFSNGFWYYTLNYPSGNSHKIESLPNISVSYIPSYKIEMRLNVNRSFDYSNYYSLLTNPFVRTYRSIYKPSGDINYRKGHSAFYTLKYKDIVHLLFANANILYRKYRYNYTPVHYTSVDQSIVTTENTPSDGKMLRIQADLSKTFGAIKTSIGISPIYTFHRSTIRQQNMLTTNKYHIYETTVKISNSKLSWLRTEYSLTGKMYQNKNSLSSSQNIYNICQNFESNFYPTKYVSIDAVANYMSLIHANNSEHTLFCDLTATYKLKRISFTIGAKNIFNTHSYTVNQFSSVNEYSQKIPLRGREIMFSAKFKF